MNHKTHLIYFFYFFTATIFLIFSFVPLVSAQVKTSETKLHPKITLIQTITITRSKTGVNQTSRSIRHFQIEDSKETRIGFMYRKIEPYLKVDAEALRIYHHSRTHNIIAKSGIATGIVSFSLAAYMLATENDNGVYMIAPGIIGFGAYYLFEAISKSKLRKSVKTYNKNSGYDFADGIE